jgi:cytochrome c peroxidase
LIPNGGALESQAILPILNSVEMAKDGRTWAEVTAKLAGIVPLAIATDLPGDIVSALAVNPIYPDLFNAAFGTPTITPSRIAFAIATYERTLVADQTPFDQFVAGNLTLSLQIPTQLANNGRARPRRGHKPLACLDVEIALLDPANDQRSLEEHRGQ